jgi:hypothetical protein
MSDEINNIKLENFVLEYDNFMSKEECEAYIDMFNKADDAGFTLTRRKSHNQQNAKINDTQLYGEDIVQHDDKITFYNGSNPVKHFIEAFWRLAYPEYTTKYDILQNAAKHGIRQLKLQKTEIGQGYHIWHCENFALAGASRILTFILYLNDVDDGGETEFLYYPLRIKPKAGKLILWPGGYTHTHRGNPPLTNTKYVVTGWVELAE